MEAGIDYGEGDLAVGQSVPRKDAFDKLTGKSRYVADITFPGQEMLWGATVRSSVARGRIRKIEFGGDIPWNEFVVVTAKDITSPAIGGRNHVAHIGIDQPVLANEEIHHQQEPVVLLAHRDRYLLEKARAAVTIEVDPLPAIFSIGESMSQREIIWGSDNTFKSFLIEKGDVVAAFEQPGLIVVEGEYSTAAQEQLYIETNGMIAVADPANGVTVWGSLQCPYYVHHALTDMLGLPAEKVRVIQAETGGGFGGKEDYPSVLACHVALLALKSGKPVKIIYDRAEDMASTTKRHPSITKHRTAVTPEGRLVAMEIDFSLDGGAYSTISSVVLSRGSIHAAGPYSCPNVRVKSRVVATNSPPNGAFRGFGAPQSLFAMERHMDKIAGALGIEPAELRRLNFLEEGSTTATGQLIRERLELGALMDRALETSGYHAKRESFADENLKSKKIKKGIGLAAFLHGAGFTGSGEKFLASIASVEATREGRVRVLVSSTEMGQGARTVFAQIAGDAIGLGPDFIDVPAPDTAEVPNSGPTVASRTTMIVGKLVETATLSLRQTLIDSGFLARRYNAQEFAGACARYIAELGPLKTSAEYKQPPDILWDDKNYKGDAYGTFAWAVYVAEVSVDLMTYQTKVDRFVTVQEVGKVINPVLASGQIEGGVTQGLGYSLYENAIFKEGRMINNTMTNYIVPTAADVPEIEVVFVEKPYEWGPQGAKGIGELPLDGVAPAILNAVQFATGVPVDHIPLLPEKLMTALKSGGASGS